MNSPLVVLRQYRVDDLSALRHIYRNAITELARAHYSAEQIRAWSGYADDEPLFSQWLASSQIVVAIDSQGLPAGFGGLQESGRISALFVQPWLARRGVASCILEHLLALPAARGAATVTTEASECSRPLFERFGFRVIEVEHTELDGVAMSRYAMARVRT